ncbi:MAG: hypothetical protein LBF42_03855, partial [Puniceicoccales bacterium]|nr:hypothetical protein [Puniceicoccales bacterium]
MRHPRRSTTASFGGAGLGVFTKILQKLSKCKTEILMMDATHLKVHRTAASYRLPVDRQRVRHPLVSGRIEATED